MPDPVVWIQSVELLQCVHLHASLHHATLVDSHARLLRHTNIITTLVSLLIPDKRRKFHFHTRVHADMSRFLHRGSSDQFQGVPRVQVLMAKKWQRRCDANGRESNQLWDT